MLICSGPSWIWKTAGREALCNLPKVNLNWRFLAFRVFLQITHIDSYFTARSWRTWWRSNRGSQTPLCFPCLPDLFRLQPICGTYFQICNSKPKRLHAFSTSFCCRSWMGRASGYDVNNLAVLCSESSWVEGRRSQQLASSFGSSPLL